jgi:hypothetical protein
MEIARIGNQIMKIEYEECPESPREWSNLGKMVCWHSRYDLGDKHNFESPQEFKEFLKENKAIVLPLYLYDHSGLSISTNRTYPFDCKWDSMQVGYIYVTYEKIMEEYSKKKITKKLREKIIDYLVGEVKTYNQYLCGEIYGYTISETKKCDLGHEHETIVDSVCGFYDKNDIFEDIEDGEKWKNAEWKEE